jgi:diacylglycerol kinase family enzyme
MDPHPRPGPRLSPDAPLFIVVNAGSGRADADSACAAIASVLDEAGRRHQILRVDAPDLLEATVANAARAAEAQGGAVVAAGGDGTLNAVARVAVARGLAYGALPQGTFNLFCRDHGLSEDIADATRALLNATVAPVQVGRVTGRVFLVNASLGLYPRLLEDREKAREALGGHRLAAIFAGLRTLMREQVQLRLEVESGGHRHSVRTPTLFVGNNRLQLRRIGIDDSGPAEDRLTGVVVRPIGTLAMFLLALRGALGRLGEAEHVDSFPFRRMSVSPRGGHRIKVAMDGEVTWLDAPLVFDVSPEPLWLLRPAPADRVALE